MHVEKHQDLNLNKNLLDKANKNTKGKKTAHLLPVRREQREYCPISTFRKTTLPVFPLKNTNVGLGRTIVVVFAKL